MLSHSRHIVFNSISSLGHKKRNDRNRERHATYLVNERSIPKLSEPIEADVRVECNRQQKARSPKHQVRREQKSATKWV